MLIAVSNLSPVSIQNLIPAYFTDLIVAPTSYCNSSSIAVAPMRLKSFSSPATTDFIFYSLLLIEILAFSYVLYHFL